MAAYDEIVDVLGLAEPIRGLSDIAVELASLGAEFDVTDRAEEAMVDGLVAKRAAARAAKDWATSDAIRDRLAELGIVVEDGADGSAWYRR
jgi:cysteinyl-tRNA synthetase